MKEIYKLEVPVVMTDINYGVATGGTPLVKFNRPIDRLMHNKLYNDPSVEMPIVPNDPSMRPPEIFKSAHAKRMVLTMTVHILEDGEPDVGDYEMINGDWI